MTDSQPSSRPIEWASRVRRSTIRWLYEQDARGIVDEELIDEVAYGFYARCRSILDATRAWREGVATCLECRSELPHHYERPRCSAARTAGGRRRGSPTGAASAVSSLLAGNAGPWFAEYLERLPQARTPRERMLLVDWMVHRLHNALPEGGEAPIGRPAAVNMIGGTLSQVAAMLDELAAVPGSRIGPPEAHAQWRARTWLPPPEAVAAAEAERRAKRAADQLRYGKRSSSDSRTISADEPSPRS